MAAGYSSNAYLTLKEFPPEYDNVYLTRSQSPREQESISAGAMAPAAVPHEGRQRITEDRSISEYPGIGLLRTEFSGAVVYTGTASLIAGGRFLLTCAHMVVEYSPITKKFVYATDMSFELRKNTIGGGSALIRRYKVAKVVVYPPYFENPTSHSGFDLAVGWIEVPEDDHYVQQLYSEYGDHMPQPLAGEYSTTKAAVVGFPGGEKWGIVREIPIHERENWMFKKDEQKEILVYDFIDTGPGQAGSPVMGMSPREVIGVHTGGNAVHKIKWATYLNPIKLKWIADTLEIPIKEDSNRLYLD